MKSASRTLISTFGAYIGVMGIEHGIGELLQGFEKAPGVIFPSWPDSPFFAIQAGEPSFSVIPIMMITGVLASLFSFAFIVMALFYPDKKFSTKFMLSLSILMFLCGSGIFPPVLAVMISLMAGRLHAPLSEWKSRVPYSFRPLLTGIWPWMFGLVIGCWITMFPVIPSLAYFFNYSNEVVIYLVLIGMFLFMFLANLSAKIRDIEFSQVEKTI